MLDTHARTAGLVTIVTPMLDGAAFLATTIESVLAQSYANVEYVIVDGGSSDDSVAIASSYGERVRLISIPKSTQTEATNAGFRASHGEYFTYLGADDILAPDAVAVMVAALEANPRAPYAYADADFIDESGSAIGRYPTRPFDIEALSHTCFVCQPASLLRSDVFERMGGLDERLHAAFDYDLWIRLALADSVPIHIERKIVGARMHLRTKSHVSRRENFPEICAMIVKHYGYVPFSWIHAWAGIAITDGDTFFAPPRGSFARTALTLGMGLTYNYRDPIRFAREYAREIVRLRREKRQHA